MSDIVIHAAGLSKLYHIGPREKYKSLRDVMANPFRRKPPIETIWALKDVSFEIKQGEVVGIIGRNGAGKSTLLKILSRITEPTEGYADITGRVGSLLEVGTGFHPELTGRENIYLNGAILGMKRAEITNQFDAIVAFAEVEKFIDTPVKHYSSGMYVRLAFAVAAHLEPEILLVDEVLAVGDTAFQKKCLGKISNIAHQGRTVLFVSHNMAVIEALCPRTIVLEASRVTFDGATTNAIHQYALESAGNRAVCHRVSPHLQWRGLLNHAVLQGLRPDQDLRFLLGFTSGHQGLRNLHVDLALHNERGEIVVHSRSKYVTTGFGIPASQFFSVCYEIRSPHLSPGHYWLTIYAYDNDNVLFWAEQIDGCSIVATPTFGIVSAFEEIKSPVFPPYHVSCSLVEKNS